MGTATHSPAYTWAFRSPCIHPVHPGQPPPQHSMGAWWQVLSVWEATSESHLRSGSLRGPGFPLLIGYQIYFYH